MGTPYVGEIILVAFNFAPAGWAFCDGQLLSIAENETLFQLIGTTYGGDGQETFALPDLRGRVPLGTGGATLGSNIGESGGAETATLTSQQIPAHNHIVDLSALAPVARCSSQLGDQLSPAGHIPAVGPYVPFTDDPLQAGVTVVKAEHFEELRSRIDLLRTSFGLGPYPHVDPTLGVGTTAIKGQHILDLRTALSEGYAAAGLTPPTFDEPITVGTTVKAAHLAEIRALVVAAPPGIAGTHSTAGPDANMRAAAIEMNGAITATNAGEGQPHENMQPFLGMRYCISLFGVFPSPT